MFGLEKFFEAFKDPKIIIPTLLAVIIVGGIGGGFWINNLKDTIAQHKELEDNKFGLLDERSKTQAYRMSTRLSDFGYEFDKTKRTLKQTEDSINASLLKIENLVSLNSSTKVKGLLKGELNNLKGKYLSYTTTLNNLDSQYKFSQEAVSTVTLNYNINQEEKYSKKSNTLLYIILASSFLILIFVLLILLKRKRKNKPSN